MWLSSSVLGGSGRGRLAVGLALAAAVFLGLILSVAPGYTVSPLAASYWASVPGSMYASTTSDLTITVKNTGSSTWTAGGPIVLDYRWTKPGTRLFMRGRDFGYQVSPDTAVASSRSHSFRIRVRPPGKPGRYVLTFDMVKGVNGWFSSRGVKVLARWVLVRGSYGAAFGTFELTAPVYAMTRYPLSLDVTNTSRMAWPSRGANRVGLVYRWTYLMGRSAGGVVAQSAPMYPTSDVTPGGPYGFAATVKAPPLPGAYRLRFDLVHTGGAYFSQRGVLTPSQTALVMGDYRVTMDETSFAMPTDVYAYGHYPATIAVTNAGNMTWDRGGAYPVVLGYRVYKGSRRVMTGRVRLPASVGPGGSVELHPQWRPPATRGAYRMVWDMWQPGYVWFSHKGGQRVETTMTVAYDYGVSWKSRRPKRKMVTDVWYPTRIVLTNTSKMVWPARGRVGLVYRWVNRRTHRTVRRGARTYFRSEVSPGETAAVSVKVVAPSSYGSYRLVWDVEHVGVAMFSSRGQPTASDVVTVKDALPHIIVDFSDFRLYLHKDGKLIKSYPVAIGAEGHETPAATWKVLERSERPMTAPQSARLMRLYRLVGGNYVRTGYGIHGTPWPWTIGTRASKGCVRMYNSDAIELYLSVPYGTPVLTRP